MASANNFSDNYAGSSGGAILWADVEPSFYDNYSYYNFQDNTAGIYANDIGSFPTKLVFLNST